MIIAKILFVILPIGAGVFLGAVFALISEEENNKMMIRKCDVGKVLFYARYDAKEMPGFRFSAAKLTITEVMFDGMFKAEEIDAWLPQDFVTSDRMFWRSWECEEYCRLRNEQQFRKKVNHARYIRAS